MVSLDPISLIVGIIVGFMTGVFTVIFYSKNEYDLNIKTASSNIAAFGYSGIWVYWHLQAAQSNWLAVPAMADFMGSIAIGFVLGIDLTILIDRLTKVPINFNKKK